MCVGVGWGGGEDSAEAPRKEGVPKASPAPQATSTLSWRSKGGLEEDRQEQAAL